MKTLTTVIQTKEGFEVFKFEGNTQKSIYPEVRKKGALVSCWESTPENDKFCEYLAKSLSF